MSARSAKPILRIVAGLPRRGKTAAVIAAFKRVLDRGDEAAFILPTARASRSLKTELLLDGTFDAFGVRG